MHETADAGVIWDMDGTLVASATVVPDAFIETVTRLGGTPPDRDGVVALYDLGDPRVMLGRMLDRPGTDGDAELYHQVLGGMAGRVRVHDGIPEVLDELRRRGVPLAVFTGNSHQAAAHLLEGTGLRAYFDVVVGGNQVPRPKPAPDGVQAAARASGSTRPAASTWATPRSTSAPPRPPGRCRCTPAGDTCTTTRTATRPRTPPPTCSDFLARLIG